VLTVRKTGGDKGGDVAYWPPGPSADIIVVV
jgi:hypothetical protein